MSQCTALGELYRQLGETERRIALHSLLEAARIVAEETPEGEVGYILVTESDQNMNGTLWPSGFLGADEETELEQYEELTDDDGLREVLDNLSDFNRETWEPFLRPGYQFTKSQGIVNGALDLGKIRSEVLLLLYPRSAA